MNKFYTSVQERKQDYQKDTKNSDNDICSPNTRLISIRSTERKSTEDDRIEMSTKSTQRKDYINSKSTNKVIICTKDFTESIKDIAEITIKSSKVFVDQENLQQQEDHLKHQEKQQKQQDNQQKAPENQPKDLENRPKQQENQLHPKHYLRYNILN